MQLELKHPLSKAVGSETKKEIRNERVSKVRENTMNNKRMEKIKGQKWPGKFFEMRWSEEGVKDCFSWLHKWRLAPTSIIAGMHELYHQLLPNELYHQNKTGTESQRKVRCQLCGNCLESVTHITSGCSTLVPTKYLTRHKAALKILFFELLNDLDLIEHTPPWYSPTTPKSKYHNNQASVYWDVPAFAENTEVRANRINARIVNRQTKEVQVIEMSCPWIENIKQKHQEKTIKYAALRWEIKQQYLDYTINEYNIIID